MIGDTRWTHSLSLPAEPKGKLVPIASRIIMHILWAARLARFDLLGAVCHLAQRVTKLALECDCRLQRLVGYLAYSKHLRTVGWVGDELGAVKPHVFDDADLAGCSETQRSTSGLHFVIMGPNTNFLLVEFQSGRGVLATLPLRPRLWPPHLRYVRWGCPFLVYGTPFSLIAL